MSWQYFNSSSYTQLSGGNNNRPHRSPVVEKYRSCYTMDNNGSPKMMLVDDSMTTRAIDCPYPPTQGASVYPGQACYAGINTFNTAMGNGQKLDDPDFPIPRCPSVTDDSSIDTSWIFPDNVSVNSNTNLIDCNNITLQYMPNETFSACFPILQNQQPSLLQNVPGQPTVTPTAPMYYSTQKACETDCLLPQSSNNDAQTVKNSLNDALAKGIQGRKPFCSQLPLCSSSATSPDTNNRVSCTVDANGQSVCVGNTKTVDADFSCLAKGQDNLYTYRVLPQKTSVTCSQLFNILPTFPPSSS